MQDENEEEEESGERERPMQGVKREMERWRDRHRESETKRTVMRT